MITVYIICGKILRELKIIFKSTEFDFLSEKSSFLDEGPKHINTNKTNF